MGPAKILRAVLLSGWRRREALYTNDEKFLDDWKIRGHGRPARDFCPSQAGRLCSQEKAKSLKLLMLGFTSRY